MIKNYTLAIALVFISLGAAAQDNYGFYGKKAYIELSSRSFIPFVYNFLTYENGAEASASGKTLVTGDSWLNTSGTLSVGYARSTRFGLSLELGYNQFRIYNNFISDDYYDDYYGIHESVKIHSFQILPKFEFAGQDGLLPNGLVHQVGIGFTINKPAEKDYLTITDSDSPNPISEEVGDFTDLQSKYTFLKLSYGLKMRRPISKSMMLSYGLNYSIDYGLGFNSSNKSIDMYREIRSYLFKNIISFDLGLALPM